jgi:aldehyde:ferredoxin oxidoreductase
VRFACLAHYWKNREGVAGRGGIGAVWGAKNLKAVTVRGSRKTAVADPARLKQLVDETREPMKKGTANLTDVRHALPHRAHQRHRCARRLQPPAGDLRPWEAIDGRSLKEHYPTGTRPASSVRSRAANSSPSPPTSRCTAASAGKMPEYETLFAFGSMLGNSNAPSIIHANILCDLLGLDSISMGVTLAFVADCLERGS